MVDFYTTIIQKLFELQPESFIGTELGNKLKILADESKYGNLQYARLIDTYFILTNTSNAEKFERIKQALTALSLEDELFIKFSN